MSFNWYIAGSGKNQKMYDFLSERIPTIGYTDNKDVNLFVAARRMYLNAVGSAWTKTCAMISSSTLAPLCRTLPWEARMTTAMVGGRKLSTYWSGSWTG